MEFARMLSFRLPSTTLLKQCCLLTRDSLTAESLLYHTRPFIYSVFLWLLINKPPDTAWRVSLLTPKMSEPLSDADRVSLLSHLAFSRTDNSLYALQIRNKRLAKLGGSATSTSSSAASPTESSSTPRPPSNIPTPQPQPEQSQDQNDAGTGESAQGKRIKITPTSATPNVPSPSASPAPAKPRAAPKAEESLETFEDRTLRALFSITLDENQQKNIHGQKLTFLPGVLSELKDEGLEIRISTGVLDQAILEAASNTGRDTPLDYLLPCWKRVRRLIKGFRKSSDNDPRFAVVSEAKRLCISYAVFAVTMPEMFGLVSFFS
jgi:hypothetical protein